MMIVDVSQWGQNPLHWTAVYLSIKQIHMLKRNEQTGAEHVLCNLHPITRATIVGFIIRVENRGDFIKFTIDDSTAKIVCIQWRNQNSAYAQERALFQDDPDTNLTLGSLVRIRGRLSHIWRRHGRTNDTEASHNQTREITIQSIIYLQNPNEEMKHWIKAAELLQNVYSKPFDYSKSPLKPSSSNKRYGMEALFNRILSALKYQDRNETISVSRPKDAFAYSNCQNQLDPETLNITVFDMQILREYGIGVELNDEIFSSMLHDMVTCGKLYSFEHRNGLYYGILDTERLLPSAVVYILSQIDDGLSVEDLSKLISSQLGNCHIPDEVLSQVLSNLLMGNHLKVASDKRYLLADRLDV